MKNEKLVNDLKKQGTFPVDSKEAEDYALENGLLSFYETSSLLGQNTKETFDSLIQGFYTTTDLYNKEVNLNQD